MKNFIKLIHEVYTQRFSLVIHKIISQKIPVAFLSIAPLDQAIEKVKNFRSQGLNIECLITLSPPPR